MIPVNAAEIKDGVFKACSTFRRDNLRANCVDGLLNPLQDVGKKVEEEEVIDERKSRRLALTKFFQEVSIWLHAVEQLYWNTDNTPPQAYNVSNVYMYTC